MTDDDLLRGELIALIDGVDAHMTFGWV